MNTFLATLLAVLGASTTAQPTPPDELVSTAAPDSGRLETDLTPMDSIRATPPPIPRYLEVSEDESSRATIRLGLHGSREDLGIAVGCGLRGRFLAGGIDLWIRPGVFTREVRTSPGRRAQYKEILYGSIPWLALDIPVLRVGPDHQPLRLAAVAAFELSDGTWYGTTKSPEMESVISLGSRATIPPGLQIELRRGFQEGLLGRWRGEIAWEF